MGDVWVKGSLYYCEQCKLNVHLNSKRSHENSKMHKNNAQRVLRNALNSHSNAKRLEHENALLLQEIDRAAVRQIGSKFKHIVQVQRKELPKTINASLYGYAGRTDDFKAASVRPTRVWEPPVEVPTISEWQSVDDAEAAAGDGLEREDEVEGGYAAWQSSASDSRANAHLSGHAFATADSSESHTKFQHPFNEHAEKEKNSLGIYEEEDQGGDKLSGFTVQEKVLKVPVSGSVSADAPDAQEAPTIIKRKRPSGMSSKSFRRK